MAPVPENWEKQGKLQYRHKPSGRELVKTRTSKGMPQIGLMSSYKSEKQVFLAKTSTFQDDSETRKMMMFVMDENPDSISEKDFYRATDKYVNR